MSVSSNQCGLRDEKSNGLDDLSWSGRRQPDPICNIFQQVAKSLPKYFDQQTRRFRSALESKHWHEGLYRPPRRSVRPWEQPERPTFHEQQLRWPAPASTGGAQAVYGFWFLVGAGSQIPSFPGFCITCCVLFYELPDANPAMHGLRISERSPSATFQIDCLSLTWHTAS